MQRSFSARRGTPRKIASTDDDDPTPGDSAAQNEPLSAVKRPPTSRTTSKKRSSLRLSFGPGEASPSGGAAGGEDSDTSSVFTPKKSNLSRIAIEKNAERKAGLLGVEKLAVRAGSEERPRYSEDYLRELREGTPRTPKEGRGDLGDEDEEGGVGEGEGGRGMELDIASKFGPLATVRDSRAGAAVIPSEAQIRVAKERRARAAKEQAYMPLSGDEDEEDRNEVMLRPKEKYPETRLVEDDEDIAEGFEDFTEDGRIALGRKSQRELERKRRDEMAEMIDQVEGGSDEDEDDSEAERREAFDEAQSRAGTYGQVDRRQDDDDRPPEPTRITPIASLSTLLERLRSRLQDKENEQLARKQQLDQLRKQRAENLKHGDYIQEQLKLTAERYEQLRLEAERSSGPATPGGSNGINGNSMLVGRGLESLGATPVAPLSDASDAGE